MPLRVLVAPDKFKGTLTARQAAEAIARGWRSARPHDELELLPISDGGDGFGEVMSELLGAETRTARTADAAHQQLEATWWWHAPTGTAIVESARVVGLALFPRGKYHPFELDTFGIGALLRAAADQEAKRCLVGLGGSATNDGGFGVGRALGWQFFDAAQVEIDRWTELSRLTSVRPPENVRLFEELIIAVDVQNLLLGPAGCSRVYGPQKGLTEFELAEHCLSRLAEVLEKQLGLTHAHTPGAGAAGGLGFGLLSFAGARVESGLDIFARHARLAERVNSAQLVITGEGALDAQTLMGKGVGEIAHLCERMSVACVGLAGVVEESEKARKKFRATHALTPDMTDPESALRAPALWLERLAAEVAARWSDEPF